jgi:hypothetical protein
MRLSVDLSLAAKPARFSGISLGSRWVSSPGEFHPEALSEPYRTLSRHTAPIKLRTPSRSHKMTSRPRPVGSSHFWLTLQVGSLTQRLGSILLSGTSSLLRAVPPLRSRIRTFALVGSPLVASPLASRSQVPMFRLTASWQAQATSHAGCHSARKQVPSELVPQ